LKTNRGFTLIEVVMTAGILACGLVAVAAVFSFTIKTNDANRRAAVATALLYEKMEEFRAAAPNDPIWLNPWDSEIVIRSGLAYRRTWNIDSNIPRKVTVAVYASKQVTIQASSLFSPTF
jgi:type II secretory pathway pseudopilin PulG